MASALAEMLAARACDPPGKSFISTAMASAIPYIVRPPASTHTAVETRCVGRVSATGASRRLLPGPRSVLREEHLLQRELAAVELDDVAGGQPGQQRSHGPANGAADALAVDLGVEDARDAGEIGDVAAVVGDRLDPVGAHGPQLLHRADAEQVPLTDEADPAADQLDLGQHV